MDEFVVGYLEVYRFFSGKMFRDKEKCCCCDYYFIRGRVVWWLILLGYFRRIMDFMIF